MAKVTNNRNRKPRKKVCILSAKGTCRLQRCRITTTFY